MLKTPLALAATLALLSSASLAEAATLTMGTGTPNVTVTLPLSAATTSLTGMAGTVPVVITSPNTFTSAMGVLVGSGPFTISTAGANFDFTDLNFSPRLSAPAGAGSVTAAGSGGSDTANLSLLQAALGTALTFDTSPVTSVLLTGSRNFGSIGPVAGNGDVLSLSGLSEIPLPATLPLFASGLGALGLVGWRRKRRAQAVA